MSAAIWERWGQRYADAVDRDILDLLNAVGEPEPSADDDRSALPRHDLTDHDDAVGASAAAGYHEISIPGLREPPAIETNEPIREEIGEFVSLRRLAMRQ